MESTGRSKRDQLAAGVSHGAQHRGPRGPRQSEKAAKFVGKRIQSGCPVLPLGGGRKSWCPESRHPRAASVRKGDEICRKTDTKWVSGAAVSKPRREMDTKWVSSAAAVSHGAQHRGPRGPRHSEKAQRFVGKRIQSGCPVLFVLKLSCLWGGSSGADLRTLCEHALSRLQSTT